MEEGGGALSLNTLSPDRINYSDVSICQRVPVAQPGHRDLPPNRRERGQMKGLKEKGVEWWEEKRTAMEEDMLARRGRQEEGNQGRT